MRNPNDSKSDTSTYIIKFGNDSYLANFIGDHDGVFVCHFLSQAMQFTEHELPNVRKRLE